VIKMRSAESDIQKELVQLRKDIRNSVHHIYGDHRQCSDFFRARSVVKDVSAETQPEDSSPPDNHGPGDNLDHGDDSEHVADEDVVPVVLQAQFSYWTEGCDEASLSEARLSGTLTSSDPDKTLLKRYFDHVRSCCE
jgi:hypothetical protein